MRKPCDCYAKTMRTTATPCFAASGCSRNPLRDPVCGPYNHLGNPVFWPRDPLKILLVGPGIPPETFSLSPEAFVNSL